MRVSETITNAAPPLVARCGRISHLTARVSLRTATAQPSPTPNFYLFSHDFFDTSYTQIYTVLGIERTDNKITSCG